MRCSIILKFFVYLRNSKNLNKLSSTTLVLRNIWHEKCTNAVPNKMGVTTVGNVGILGYSESEILKTLENSSDCVFFCKNRGALILSRCITFPLDSRIKTSLSLTILTLTKILIFTPIVKHMPPNKPEEKKPIDRRTV